MVLPPSWDECIEAAEVAAGTGVPTGEAKATVSAYLTTVQNLKCPKAVVGVFCEDFDQSHADFPKAVYDKGVLTRTLL